MKQSLRPPTPWYSSYPADVPPRASHSLYRDLVQMFTAACARYPRRTAYLSFGRRLSYRDTAAAVTAFSAYLRHLGVGPGIKVAVILPNLLQFPVTVFGILSAGGTAVNINPLYTPTEMCCVLRDSGAAVAVTTELTARGLQSVLAQTQVRRLIVTGIGDLLGMWRGFGLNAWLRYGRRAVPAYARREIIPFRRALAAGRRLPPPHPPADADAAAFLQYTGGTTGKPKGAILTHANLLANITQLLSMYGKIVKDGEETILTPLPLYHVFALTINLLLPVYIACTNILVVDPRRLPSLGRLMRRHPEITVVTGVNTLYNGLINRHLLDRTTLPRLKLAIGGGTAVQSGVDARFFQLTGRHILEGYGLTECSPVTCLNPYTETRFTGAIGLPLPDTLARIVDLQTGDEIWETETPGELQFRGPQVMRGYYHNDRENAAVRDGPWLRTGDVAAWLPGGYLKIIDRIKDMILVSGFNVYPSEIEDVVSRMEQVGECACVGVPSPRTGEAVKLFVVRKDPALTHAALLAYCRQYLTGYKIPHVIEFVERLPKTPVGKVMRRYLKQHRLTD